MPNASALVLADKFSGIADTVDARVRAAWEVNRRENATDILEAVPVCAIGVVSDKTASVVDAINVRRRAAWIIDNAKVQGGRCDRHRQLSKNGHFKRNKYQTRRHYLELTNILAHYGLIWY